MNDPITNVDPKAREFLLTALPAWRTEGLITAETETELVRRYALNTQPGSRFNRFNAGIAILGGILLGVGVILFVASNWEAMPRGLRLGLLLSLIAGGGHLGWRLSARPASGPAEAAYCFTALAYGAGIALTGQMYHMPPNLSGFLWVWAVGLAPFVAVTRSPWVLTFATLLAGVLASVEVMMEYHTAWAAAALVTAFYLVALYWRASLAVLAGYYGLIFWASFNLFQIEFFAEEASTLVEGFFVAPLTLAVALGRAQHGPDRFAGRALRWLAHRLLLVLLYLLGFEFTLDHLSTAVLLGEGRQLAGFMAMAGVVAYGVRRAFQLHQRGQKAAMLEMAAVGALSLAGLLVVMAVSGFHLRGAIWMLLTNLLFIAAALTTVAVGMRVRDSALAVFGAVAVAVLILTRFFDTFYTALPRSLAFIAAGLLMFALFKALQRGRQRILAWTEEA